MPTTTLSLQCVIDHAGALPDEGPLEKLVALALMGRDDVHGARVSRILARTGEPHRIPEEPAWPAAESHERTRAAAELAQATAMICPNAMVLGDPHRYAVDAIGPQRVCLHCGRPEAQAIALEPAPVLKLNPMPDPQHCPGNDGGPHDFNPGNANKGRVCPRCGCANPAPPRGKPREFQGNTLMEG